uniref:Vesicle transport protein n=1 Tax=Haemonchus placei TaxID=6290 RepID=A0A0N4WDG2_HAEPC
LLEVTQARFLHHQDPDPSACPDLRFLFPRRCWITFCSCFFLLFLSFLFGFLKLFLLLFYLFNGGIGRNILSFLWPAIGR